MSTLKGTTMHPRCRHIGACWDLLEWFQLFSTSQNTSRIQFRTFLKEKNQIFWFPCCSTREDLSVDVSITYVGMILTKPGRFFSRHTETRGKDRIQFRQFRTFWKNFTFLGFHGMMYQLLFEKKKIKFSGFHGVVLVKNFPLMYQLLM